MANLVARQFDVFENPTVERRDAVPYVVILQSHHLQALNTTVVAPLMRHTVVQPNKAVAIEVRFAGGTLTLNVALLANLPIGLLQRRIGSLAERDIDIHQAVNRLLVGF